MMNHEVKIIPEGDSGMLLQWQQNISPDITAAVDEVLQRLHHARIVGITDLVPAYCSLLICYDPTVILWPALYEKVQTVLQDDSAGRMASHRIFEIPVLYDGEDMARVLSHTGLDKQELIELHTKPDYLVHMIGFLPGFPYLGGMSEKLRVPRLEEPRLLIPAGSVGIGGSQTGIYSLPSPGGWNLIGRTPVRIYDSAESEPVLFRTGDRIRFIAVTQEEYEKTEDNIRSGRKGYRVKDGDEEWASV